MGRRHGLTVKVEAWRLKGRVIESRSLLYISFTFYIVRTLRILRTLRTKWKSGEVWFRTLRTLRKIVPTMRIWRYLRTRTGVRIYAILGTPSCNTEFT